MNHKNPEILDDFLNYIRVVKGSSELTIKEYDYDLNRFLKYVKLTSLSGPIDYTILDSMEFKASDIGLLEVLNPRDIYAYLSYLDKERENAPRTRARKLASLRTFFDYLVNKVGLISNDPSSSVDSPKLSKTQPIYLTLNESRELLQAIKEEENDFIRTRDFAMVTLFLNLGIRLSELRDMNLIDIKNKSLRVRGKGDKERTLFVNTACINALNEYLEYRPDIEDENAMFLSTRNKRISTRSIQSRVEKYIKAIGLDPRLYTVHKLRHTAATLLHKYGHTDIRTLQVLLGHESVQTTEIYTHVDNEALRSALDKNPLNEL